MLSIVQLAVLLRERSASGPVVSLVPTRTGTDAWKQKMKEGKMDELEEVRLRDATMSHHEIMVRFRKLFGREMTPKERQAFFLPHDSSAVPEENS